MIRVYKKSHAHFNEGGRKTFQENIRVNIISVPYTQSLKGQTASGVLVRAMSLIILQRTNLFNLFINLLF